MFFQKTPLPAGASSLTPAQLDDLKRLHAAPIWRRTHIRLATPDEIAAMRRADPTAPDNDAVTVSALSDGPYGLSASWLTAAAAASLIRPSPPPPHPSALIELDDDTCGGRRHGQR